MRLFFILKPVNDPGGYHFDLILGHFCIERITKRCFISDTVKVQNLFIIRKFLSQNCNIIIR